MRASVYRSGRLCLLAETDQDEVVLELLLPAHFSHDEKTGVVQITRVRRRLIAKEQYHTRATEHRGNERITLVGMPEGPALTRRGLTSIVYEFCQERSVLTFTFNVIPIVVEKPAEFVYDERPPLTLAGAKEAVDALNRFVSADPSVYLDVVNDGEGPRLALFRTRRVR